MRSTRFGSLVAIVAALVVAPSFIPTPNMTPVLHGQIATHGEMRFAPLSAHLMDKFAPVVFAQSAAAQQNATAFAYSGASDAYEPVCSGFEGGYSCQGAYYGQPTTLFYVLGLLCGLEPYACFEYCHWTYAAYDDGGYSYLDDCGQSYAGFY